MTLKNLLLVVLLCVPSCDRRPVGLADALALDSRSNADARTRSADSAPAPRGDSSRSETSTPARKSCCPPDICQIGCGPGGEGGGCAAACVPLPCSTISAAECPLSRCQLMIDCAGKPVCYYLFSAPPPACGAVSYYGQDVPCCTGLVKRCGAVLPDGSCSATTGGYQGLPQCLACGNGICEQFENKCNCPEDCAK